MNPLHNLCYRSSDCCDNFSG